MQFIDLKAQYARLREPIRERIDTVLEHGQFILGPEVEELERRLADYVGTAHCVTVSSGSDALLIALMALGVEPGDEIITTPFTFIATAEMIALTGAVPVFVDIEPETCNLDPAQIEAAITSKTRAIMPVNLYGQCADYARINAVAANHGLAVIEDAAQSFGATQRGARSGSLGLIGCTSFFPAKPFGCYGDGGACFTDDPELAESMRSLHVHGMDRPYIHEQIGINGRMDTLQAAILLAKFDSFPAEVDLRATIGARYCALFEKRCPELTIPVIAPENAHVFAQFTLQASARDGIVQAVREQGVPVAVHYPLPLHRQPAIAGKSRIAGENGLPIAEAACERVFSVPMHPFLAQEAQDRVVDAVAQAMANR